MVMCATYTPALRGWRVRGNVCYLHAGPEREACAWYCILNAAYTPAPRGRRVRGALNAAYTPAPSGRRVCGTASALPPANRGGGHTPLMDRGSQLDTAAPHARRLNLPGEKRSLVLDGPCDASHGRGLPWTIRGNSGGCWHDMPRGPPAVAPTGATTSGGSSVSDDRETSRSRLTASAAPSARLIRTT